MGLIDEIQGFPRHLSQHVGGFIITEGRLDELCRSKTPRWKTARSSLGQGRHRQR
jgi:DNA polymerase III alpha subunit